MAYDLYPAVDEDLNFAQAVRIALGKSMELRHQVVPMTTVQRNSLTGDQLWDGRVIVNTTKKLIERYDISTGAWVSIPDMDWMAQNTYKIYHGTGAPPTTGTFNNGDVYCQYL